MRKAVVVAVGLAAALSTPLAAEQPNAKTVIAIASKAMGVDGLDAIHYYGVAQIGNLGQNNNANQPWPLTAANDYVRAIDFTTRTSLATWTTYAVPVTGGRATLAQGTPQTQQLITPQSPWAQQVENYITPWGFLKAVATMDDVVLGRALIGGREYRTITARGRATSPSGVPYKVVGYIGRGNLVERVRTWIENPIFGDMLVDTEYNFYRDSNGLKFPAQIIQRRGGWPTFTAYIRGAHANPPDIQRLLTPPATAARGGGPGGSAAGGPPPAPTAYSERLADGVYRIGQRPAAGTYNSVAIEFADHVVLFEPGPQNEARAQAIIAETKRVIPNKPIRYGVISHHHFDHTSGLPAVVAEGITIVTPQVNRALLMKALSSPRTLSGDSLAKSGKRPVIEGFTGDKRVFHDATRTLEVHVIKGLPHADGLVVGYLPNEKILIYADMFNLPPAGDPVPNPPVVGTQVFVANMDRLKLTPEKIVSIHTLDPANDGRTTTPAEIRASLGLK
jgi:glyoxylase-like metal-dependent hydrolase (beta-lactamase superfamily II)